MTADVIYITAPFFGQIVSAIQVYSLSGAFSYSVPNTLPIGMIILNQEMNFFYATMGTLGTNILLTNTVVNFNSTSVIYQSSFFAGYTCLAMTAADELLACDEVDGRLNKLNSDGEIEQSYTPNQTLGVGRVITNSLGDVYFSNLIAGLIYKFNTYNDMMTIISLPSSNLITIALTLDGNNNVYNFGSNRSSSSFVTCYDSKDKQLLTVPYNEIIPEFMDEDRNIYIWDGCSRLSNRNYNVYYTIASLSAGQYFQFVVELPGCPLEDATVYRNGTVYIGYGQRVRVFGVAVIRLDKTAERQNVSAIVNVTSSPIQTVFGIAVDSQANIYLTDGRAIYIYNSSNATSSNDDNDDDDEEDLIIEAIVDSTLIVVIVLVFAFILWLCSCWVPSRQQQEHASLLDSTRLAISYHG